MTPDMERELRMIDLHLEKAIAVCKDEAVEEALIQIRIDVNGLLESLADPRGHRFGRDRAACG